MKKIIYTLIIALFIACGSDDSGPVPAPINDEFNRTKMLTFWADDIIIPGYQDLALKSANMNNAIVEFSTTPSDVNLKKARDAWKEAYISWQKVSIFQIGKAQEFNLVGSMNTYPTNTAKLLDYADRVEKPNFASSNLHAIQGFPALDYLLYGVGSTDGEIIQYYKSETKVKEYLGKVSAHLNSLASQVSEDWEIYRGKFIANNGSSTTSSVDVLVNFYVIPFYEKQLRENKIATPSGVRNQGKTAPEKVEAFYHGSMSKTLFSTTLIATTNFFNGTSYDGTHRGLSLQQYLESLNRKDLSDLINANFLKINDLSSGLDEDFVSQLKDVNKRKVMEDIFNSLQVVLKNFKPDMMSALSIKITSTDTDND